MRIKALIVSGIFLMTGCNSIYTTYSGQPAIAASSGSTIVINEKINVKPGVTRVFIQDGIIVRGFNHYKTSCNIEVRKKDNENWQFIEPAEYNITGSQSTLENVVNSQPLAPLKLASNSSAFYGRFTLVGGRGDSSPADIYLGIHYYLSGPDANVMRLSCRGALASPWEAEYPTRIEIDQALGEIIKLKL
jgi:hypothetical protein